MITWVLHFLEQYWPAILIIMGIGYMIYGVKEDEIGEGIFSLIFFGGLGVLFFIFPPGEIWSWLSQFELVKFLFSGKWYEVVLKVTGALAAIGMVIKILINVIQE